MAWQATALTLFPEMFPGPLGFSLAGRALKSGSWSLETVDIRHFARDKHATVDDAPFGGGAGMVLRPDVVDAALGSVQAAGRPVVSLSPRGHVFDQAMARRFAGEPGLVLLCGRYEGIDQRVLDARSVEEVSLGDFVLSGGEPAALCLIDAVVRLLPGVMGNHDSAGEESFGEMSGAGADAVLLEYPHYTRPATWTGPDGVPRTVPDILVSGDHGRVRAWRREQAESITRERRPDLWRQYCAAMYGYRR